jgi:hypothetical protein
MEVLEVLDFERFVSLSISVDCGTEVLAAITDTIPLSNTTNTSNTVIIPLTASLSPIYVYNSHTSQFIEAEDEVFGDAIHRVLV